MKAYSMDFRERVLADCDEGLKARSVCAPGQRADAVIPDSEGGANEVRG
jgi:hypothetical protein